MIEGNAALGIRSAGGGAASELGVLAVTGSLVSGNRTEELSGNGAGLHAEGGMLVLDSRIVGNTVEGRGTGGGLQIDSGTLVVARSEVSGNLTTQNGGQGGGLVADREGTETFVLDSVVEGNGTLGQGSRGGGISARDLTVVNSTVAGNFTSGPSAQGGGIAAFGSMTLVASTVTGNSTAETGGAGGGIRAFPSAPVTLVNSIVLGNANAAVGADTREIFVAGSALSFLGSNIVGSDADSFDATSANPDIASGADAVANADPAAVFALPVETRADLDGSGSPEAGTGVTGGGPADNLGQRATVALAEGANPAVDAGDGAVALLLDETKLGLDLNGDGDLSDLLTRADQIRFDSRGEGFARETGAAPDLGAFELGSAPVQAAAADGVVRGTGRDDVIAVAQNAIYLGQDGDDTFLLSRAAVPDARSVVSDDPGTVIELADGLVVVSSLVAGDAIELVLANGARIQLLESEGYLFSLGGNATSGQRGEVVDFGTFVQDVLGAADTGSFLEGGTVLIGASPGADLDML